MLQAKTLPPRMRPALPHAAAVLLLALAACRAPAPPPPAAAEKTAASAAVENGAISTPAPKRVPPAKDVLQGTKWPEAKLESGTATVGCESDYAAAGDGAPLADLGFF